MSASAIFSLLSSHVSTMVRVPVILFHPLLKSYIPSSSYSDRATAPFMSLMILASILYISVTSFIRVLDNYSANIRTARALRASGMGMAARTWAIGSLVASILVFLLDTLQAVGGFEALDAMARSGKMPVAARKTPTAASMGRSWAFTLCAIVVDACLTAAAVSPCILRAAVTIAPPLRSIIYNSENVGKPKMSEDEGESGSNSATPMPPSLGASVELLRTLDASDVLAARLLLLALFVALAMLGA